MKIKTTLLLLFLLSFSATFAQVLVPSSDTSCPSGDLSLVGATLTGGDLCNSCDSGTLVTKTLTLSINNSTGSTRTSFAFWGDLEEYSGDDGSLVKTTPISGCKGPVPDKRITNLNFSDISFTCGNTLKITNLFLAWTDASPNSICPLDPASISPKCGKLPSIEINSGVNAEFILTDTKCNIGNGSIDLKPVGGKAPYTYSWTTLDGNIPTAQLNNEDLTNLVAGTYTVTITDANNCSITKSRTINENAPPACSITGAAGPVCPSSSNTYAAPVGMKTYKWSLVSGNGATIVTGTEDDKDVTVLAGLVCNSSFTLSLTVTDENGCTSTCEKTVNVIDSTTPKPSVKLSDIILTGCNGNFPAPDIKLITVEAGACSIPLVAFVSDSAPTLNGCNETTLRTYSVTDACGNSITVTQKLIRTIDTTKPTASNPSDITITGCNGTFPLPDTTVVIDAMDTCSIPLVAFVSDSTPTLNGCNETTLRTYSATDACGNSITVTQKLIRTIDTTKPTASNPSDITITGCNGTFPLPDTAVVIDAMDTCSIPVVAFVSDSTPTLNGCNETTLRTYSVTDACGNSITVTQKLIRTIDTTKPTASNPSDITITGCNGTFPLPDTTVVIDEADTCSIPVVAFVSDSAPTLNGCNETTLRTYSVTDACGNSITVTQKLIRTIDTTKPTASNPSDITITGCNGAFPLPDTAVVIDEADTCSIPLVAFVSDSAPTLNGCNETTLRTYSVTDACGNSINVTQKLIRTIDTTKPTASNPSDITITGCNGTFPLPDTAVVIDEADTCSIPVVAFVSDSAPTLNGCNETTLRTYSVTDACGNSIMVTQKLIRTIDTTKPTASNPSDITITGCNGTFPLPDTTVVIDEADTCSIPLVAFVSDSAPTLNGCNETTLRTYSVTDACGNSINVTQKLIRLVDQTAPVIAALPSAMTISCPGAPLFANATATDDCDAAFTLTSADVTTPGACAGEYSITRIWTATDACNNVSTASQTINVQDDTAPTFTIPQNITISNAENCIANTNPTVTGTLTNIKDICDSNPIVTYKDDNCFGSSPENGSINSGSGNYFPFVVSGFDDLSASNIEKIALAFETNQGKGRAEFTLVSPSGQGIILVGPYCTGGECDDATSNSKELYLPVFYPNSSEYIQWNNSNFIQVGSAQNFKPYGTTTSPNTIAGLTSYVSSFENFTGPMNGTWFIYARKQAQVNGSIDFKSVCLTPAISCPVTQFIARTWAVTDACGNKTTATQTIKIEDKTAPVFVETLPKNLTVECSMVPAPAILTATDNCSAITVNFVENSVAGACAGSYILTRTWTAIDACGTATTHSQIINVQDTTAPTFIGTLPENVTVECSAVPTAATLTAADNCGGATVKFTESSVAGTNSGSFVLIRTWTATDACGLTTIHSQTVTVQDTTAPTVSETILQDVTAECSVVLMPPTAADACSGTITGTTTTVFPITTQGTTVVTWTFVDSNGNIETATQNVIINDTTKPTKPILTDVNGICSATVLAPSTTDNCSGTITGTTTTVFPITTKGTTVVIWTFTDAKGNTETATQNVIIADTTKPIKPVLTDVFGQCSAVVTHPTTTDDCSGTITGTTSTVFPITTQGTTVVTWTFTDGNGNVETATQNVIITDTTLPTISCAGPVTVKLDSAACYASNVTLDIPSTADNCVVASVSNDAPNTFPIGTTTVTWTVTDGAGLTASCEQTVTVIGSIIANDDIGTNVNGSIGGVALINVLTNDLLNCKTANSADIITTFISSTNSGVTLSGTNVLVAPGTPAGSYTLVYSICEILNPTNCDTATVTVTVNAAAIVANDDAGNAVNGSTGGTAVANVLSNDTLNGVAVVPAQVNTTFVSSTNAEITLSGTTVMVAAGTPAGSYTLVYSICEILNPTNCDTATVTVTVNAAAIVANDDAGTAVNGSIGGTAVPNVLSNDTLNGVEVVPDQVNTTFVSSTNAGITLSGTTVMVAAGTPAGSYSLVYSICEILNPTNCDTATVSVIVNAAAIVANDDAGNAVNGSTGGTASTNVLSNDTLNGVAVDPAQVNTTFVSSTNAGITLSGTTVMVAAGTPAGSYTLVYSICEILNPTNCDTATVSVIVNAASIVANDDAGNAVNGSTGGTAVANVLSNDTLNGVAVLPSQVNTTFVSSTNAGITLSGTTVMVAAGTPVGSYTLVYSICEILNPTNCDTATVTVTVNAAAIVANDDAGTAVNGSIGGTASTNVLSNDTLNGVAVVPDQVNTTFVSSMNSGITLSGTTVMVAAGTPAGSYSLVYSICEILNPTNCDTATVSVIVNAAAIVANDDAGNAVNGSTGGTAVANVLSNDMLNGVAVLPSQVNTTFVSSTNAGITLSGTTVLVDAGTPAGSYSLVYSICEILNPTNCDTATVTVTVNATAIVANDDAGNAVNGSAGGTAVTNVLSNDTLNGVAVVPAQVNTTFVSSTNAGITLSGTTVMVAAGTPAGSYTLVYSICEILNPTNCDTATVTVTVKAAAIVANDDAGNAVNGSTGGTAVANVLSNDMLNGVAVLPSQVNTTFVSSTNAGITLSGTTVLVDAGTPAGSYSLVYSICEILNPTNCDTATVTVTVNAAAIVANDDAGTAVNGSIGGTAVTNVLSNDTLNGVAVVAAQVNTTFVSSTNAGITLSGTSVLVAAGTPAGSYSLVYSICEILNPTNCDTATVTVTVNAAAIVANDDAGTAVNGSIGGTAVANVLSNDTLNGVAVVPAQVNTTVVSSTNAGITLSGTTVIVAAGTPAGSYSLVYSICEILNPTNCDTATVTVTVNAAAIVANDDAGNAVNGSTGGTAVANVLSNDTLNGVAVVPAQVNTTFVSSTNAGITLSGTTVMVAAGTPAGSYTLVYSICEILNPTNCDTATVSVIVNAASIVANDDAGTAVNGSIGGTASANVLSNDTLNGVAVLPSQVNTTFVSSTNAGITLSGTTVIVAAGTTAGSYTLVYSICEILNPTNCDTATVTVTVNAAAIVANDDAGTAVNGSTGGTAVANVLSNDTLNGAAVDPAQVNTTFVSSTNAGITLSGTTVIVAAGTPAGSYTLVYSICEILNPTNCDTATVNVTVNAAAIVANDDAGTAVNGSKGGTAVANVLSNDTLNGAAVDPAQVNTTFVSSTNAGITLSGTTVMVAAETPAGSYTLVYSICEILNPTNCDTATVTVTVNAAAIVANDDAGTAVNGSTGGTAVANVLSNDTLNGAAVDPAQVNTTFVSSTNAGITLSGTTVIVAAGTTAGSYTLVYSICEILNPTNCDTATVTVTVNAAAIVANDDAGTAVNGSIGGTASTNVLSNDTLNGVAVLPSQVNTTFVSSTNAGITLSGTTVQVAAGTPAGSYTLVYSICEILNPTNCDTATVTVTVNAAAIAANDDAGTAVNGSTGGTAVTNVLSNDTLNGVAVNPAQVNTTFVSSTNAGITLSGTTVLVAAGTPAGSYSLVYSICEILNPTNCDTATVSVIVNAASIVANDDAGTAVNGSIGGTASTNVLSNDTLNGVAVVPAQVNTTFVSSTNAGITLSGTTVMVAAGTPAGSYSLVYSICEILNPTNCDTATVTVTVNAAAIVANDDAGNAVNGSTGGTAVANVLSNDTLNGVAVLPSQVNTTFVSSTNAGITLSGTTVMVAAGTPAGSYSLVYSICEILNPTNCDTATVTVTVNAAAIVANDDAGTAVNGSAGGTAVANVLSNDTLNGVAVDPAQVNTTFVSSTNAGITLSGTSVLVAAGTPVGSYTLVYNICEILNPTNCDQANVTVIVTGANIVANDDAGNAVNGSTGGTAVTNVLSNDTLNGVAVLPAQVNTTFVSSTNAGITLSGTTVLVAAGTPAGSYTLVYSICEILNPTNCDQANVTVTVTGANIVANDDVGNEVNGSEGGTALTNILSNDTLNGAAVIAAQVNTTFVSSTNTGITLSGTSVLVAAGTPSGTYTLIYQICEILNPTNCDQATVSVIVTAPGIVLGCGTVTVHNAFSPNGDGINEVFTIDNIDDTLCYPENTVSIYNRWGVLVYETSGYNNNDKAFRGVSEGRSTISQSSGLPTGTYFYILNYTSIDGNGGVKTNTKDGYLYLTSN
ncbi:gliding motility-associated C-terminal domain-containing protein [Flavobacterium caseinilyticum]|uniref:Gliding motility-associated C-terminal domain-containing protein n=1 Tax=Flavobacterium caseinilyticum TaxID=2541732 RepID=A0A4R5AS42_9FLAO|nr:gliding motility-associated C-terminal domain-containing protein [Flavobacterium caseinilyticum]TDD73924.1 gliding motility-associated C-terminal domain-containing protein [Flavobacterium caseinilyticum]